MKSLMDLAARVKQLEDSAAAVQERNRAALQTRREELDAAIDREVQEFGKTTAEAEEAARSWWSDAKGSIERQIAAMRADFENRQAEHKHHNAEGAVVRAELARGEADQLVARS